MRYSRHFQTPKYHICWLCELCNPRNLPIGLQTHWQPTESNHWHHQQSLTPRTVGNGTTTPTGYDTCRVSPATTPHSLAPGQARWRCHCQCCGGRDFPPADWPGVGTRRVGSNGPKWEIWGIGIVSLHWTIPPKWMILGYGYPHFRKPPYNVNIGLINPCD